MRSPGALLLVALLIGQAGPSNTVDIVVVSNPTIVPAPRNQHFVEFIVTNNGDVAVTAWGVAVEAIFSDDSVRTMGVAVEGYGAYEGLTSSENRAIPPHGSARGRILFGENGGHTIVAARTALRWAVFADGSGIGDPAGREDIFRQREREYQAWSFVLTTLKTAQTRGSGRQGLSLALQGLNVQSQEDHEHPVKRQMRRNLQMAVEGHPSITASPDDFLRKWISRAQLELNAADTHRRPRPSGREGA